MENINLLLLVFSHRHGKMVSMLVNYFISAEKIFFHVKMLINRLYSIKFGLELKLELKLIKTVYSINKFL